MNFAECFQTLMTYRVRQAFAHISIRLLFKHTVNTETRLYSVKTCSYLRPWLIILYYSGLGSGFPSQSRHLVSTLQCGLDFNKNICTLIFSFQFIHQRQACRL